MAASKLLRCTPLLWAAVFQCCATSGVGNQGSDDKGLERLQLLEACTSRLDESLAKSLGSRSKPFQEIRRAVRWAAQHLPHDIAHALQVGGGRAVQEVSGQRWQMTSEGREKFMSLLYQDTFQALSETEAGQSQVCQSVLFDELANYLNLKLRLADEPLRSEFKNLGLNDSYQIENAFLRMVILEVTGVQWKEQWFAEAKF